MHSRLPFFAECPAHDGKKRRSEWDRHRKRQFRFESPPPVLRIEFGPPHQPLVVLGQSTDVGLLHETGGDHRIVDNGCPVAASVTAQTTARCAKKGCPKQRSTARKTHRIGVFWFFMPKKYPLAIKFPSSPHDICETKRTGTTAASCLYRETEFTPSKMLQTR